MSKDEPEVVRIRVVHESGESEILTLTGPLTIMPRVPESPFTKLKTSTGMEHWFTDDGFYDGWGMDVQGMVVADPRGASFRWRGNATRRDKPIPKR